MTAAADRFFERLSARGAPLARLLTARRGVLPIALLAALACVATLYLFYPGFMSRDSGNQLLQAREGIFNDHHPILMALIWRFTDRLVPGPFGVLMVIHILYWAGLAGIVLAIEGPLALRALGMLAVGTFLPSLCCLAGVWKDTLMHASLLAGIACAVVPVSRAGWLRYLVAPTLLLLAIGLRHNAAAAVWPLLVLLIIEGPLLSQRPRWLRLLVACALALALTLVLTLGLKRVLAPFARAQNFWQRTVAFDLAGISLRTGKLVIDPRTGLLGPGMGMTEIGRQFRPDFNDSLWYCGYADDQRCVPLFNTLYDEAQLSLLLDNWQRAIRAHPRAYLEQKLDMTARLMRVGGLEPTRRYFYLDYAPHHDLAGTYFPPPRTVRMLGWMDLQQTWIGFSPLIYTVLALFLVPFTLFRHLRGGPLLPLCLTLSGLSYLLSVLLGAGGPDPRYTVWTMLCTLLALLGTFAGDLERLGRWLVTRARASVVKR
jgi:hypothetical protein